jgi:hypothetical protein
MTGCYRDHRKTELNQHYLATGRRLFSNCPLDLTSRVVTIILIHAIGRE